MAGKKVKLETGTVYQKKENGTYYFRYQLNGQRKAVSLKTKNQKEAIKKAKEFVPVVKATTTEMISAHVKHARGLESKKRHLPLTGIWDVYSKHPDRATPATVHEQQSYKSTLQEFIKFVDNDSFGVADITPEITDEFAQHMRGKDYAVDTHNRKIRRLKKIFEVLDKYRTQNNPFTAKSLFRKEREERHYTVRRLSFTKEQEQEILKVLDDDSKEVKNKPEIKVVFYLGMFTGQRLKDCALLQWNKIDMKRRRIEVKQFKTGKEVSIPIAPQLYNILEEAKTWKTNHYVCPNVAKRYNGIDKNGKNIGSNLIGVDVLRVIRWIGVETSVAVPGRKKKVTVYGFHSLRHSFASHCAEAGVPKAVVLSILGANSEIVDKHYTHIGEEAQEKAIESVFGQANSISDRERIEQALALIDSWKKKTKQTLEIENILKS